MLKRSILLPALSLLAVCLLAPPTFADSVTLTGGAASTFIDTGTVDLFGDAFVLRYFGEIGPATTRSIRMNSVTQSIGLPSLTFGGVTSRYFGGSLAFSDSVLTGGITAYATMDDMFFETSPLFTLTFSGTGFVNQTLLDGFLRTEFTVQNQSSPIPEPASMLLLGAGLAGIAASRSRRRKAQSSDSKL